MWQISPSPDDLEGCGAVDKTNGGPDETQQLHLFMNRAYCTERVVNGAEAQREREFFFFFLNYVLQIVPVDLLVLV